MLIHLILGRHNSPLDTLLANNINTIIKNSILMKNIFLKSIFVAFVAIITFSCDSAADNNEVVVPKQSILEILKGDSNYSILVAAIKKAGLDLPGASPLSSAGSFTVFAPTNTAFAASLPTFTEANITALTAASEIANLKQIILNHMLVGAVKSGDLVNDTYVKTYAQYNNSSTLLSLYVTTTGGVKLNGGSALVGTNGANVTSADRLANNGIIHTLDKVLLLPTILNHAVANPALSRLVSIVTSTDAASAIGDQTAVKNALANALPGATALTVYAPINDAFIAATAEGTGYLTGAAVTPANVTKVLQYHVENSNRVASSATAFIAATATADLSVTTLSTQKFLVTKGTVKITELPAVSTIPASNIRTVNIQGTNGSLHIIDRVLKPVF
jgi:uncharacterized surface protein with fasciclin (FAS1) repeats